MALIASTPSDSDGAPSAADARARADAIAWAEKMIVDLQSGVVLPAAAVAKFIRDCDRRGWAEAAIAGLYLNVIRNERAPVETQLDAIAALLDRAIDDGEQSMAALALARRARVMTNSGDPASRVEASRELARAAVLLETATGDSPFRARAHVNCAIAFGQRDEWELEDEHYIAAENVLAGARAPSRLGWSILYNRAEVQLNWTCALRELGDTKEAERRALFAAAAIRAAQASTMPSSWKVDLRAFASLIDAIAPATAVKGARDAEPEGDYAGLVHLARALRATDRAAAIEEADRAVRLIDPRDSQNVYNLALCVAAEIESKVAGKPTAGLRYAHHLAALRWEFRLAALASMQSLIHAEQLRSEHDLLSQHAYLDDLTKLGNRRALFRHVDGLVARGVSSVTIVVIDIDCFKGVNDNHGHAVGDETLVRVASVLRSAVRVGDLAVRIGGDEFMLVLASTEARAARRRSETILQAVKTQAWDEVSRGLSVTASAGLACGEPNALTAIISAADEALYRSKAVGGDLVSEG